ncbi:plasmid stabilization protein [Candidatus Methylomirabilis limnetica]|jgi:mRNA interferase RelE/StbE|uniref:Plasmid stabilization protein n=1 Tax=Candidatus Methylomirabilis limnetica TaxID=2033718 RepID=A0A2T4TXQ3_9BACT|nr:type II toxin-antitoxin system RelE/ParE family toxin [Candidatus Methylomirabilis limnetica]PTL35896.1 plasmid stabilization protein [Candidatus Methylomirabilis limnetica]
MPYEIRYHPEVRKVLARLDASMHRRILEAIEALKENPYRGQKLREVHVGQWRLRVGPYRIRYDIAEDEVFILRIGHRREIYR